MLASHVIDSASGVDSYCDQLREMMHKAIKRGLAIRGGIRVRYEDVLCVGLTAAEFEVEIGTPEQVAALEQWAANNVAFWLVRELPTTERMK